jgi:hypothetical protein
MSINSVGSSNAVPAMAYAPPAVRTEPVRADDQKNDKKTSALDDLLDQLSTVLNNSVKTKNSSTPLAILAQLEPGASKDAEPSGDIPPTLQALINTVTGQAAQAGKAEEFTALLKEYVAVKWALTELDAVIQARIVDKGGDGNDYHSQQLAEAFAFLEQFEWFLANKLERKEAPESVSDWLKTFQEELAASQSEDKPATVSIPVDADAISIVEQLLSAAPRPELLAA